MIFEIGVLHLSIPPIVTLRTAWSNHCHVVGPSIFDVLLQSHVSMYKAQSTRPESAL